MNILSQQVITAVKTDRQASYQPKTDSSFRIQTQTPLLVGLALTVHKKTRSKDLVNRLSQLQLGASYTETASIEKRIAYGVAEQIEKTGGFCLPPFIKKGKSLYFAADNVDFLENTADGQNTLHGTLLVVNQQEDETKPPVNEPIIIPKTVVPFQLETHYYDSQAVVPKPITFEEFKFESYQDMTRKYEACDLAWLMASYCNSREKGATQLEHVEEEQIESLEEEQDCQDSQSPSSSQNDIDSQNYQSKVLKSDIMPTLAATNSLLIQSSRQGGSPKKTNTGIVVKKTTN